jgi:hypothetical protein
MEFNYLYWGIQKFLALRFNITPQAVKAIERNKTRCLLLMSFELHILSYYLSIIGLSVLLLPPIVPLYVRISFLVYTLVTREDINLTQFLLLILLTLSFMPNFPKTLKLSELPLGNSETFIRCILVHSLRTVLLPGVPLWKIHFVVIRKCQAENYHIYSLYCIWFCIIRWFSDLFK